MEELSSNFGCSIANLISHMCKEAHQANLVQNQTQLYFPMHKYTFLYTQYYLILLTVCAHPLNQWQNSIHSPSNAKVNLLLKVHLEVHEEGTTTPIPWEGQAPSLQEMLTFRRNACPSRSLGSILESALSITSSYSFLDILLPNVFNVSPFLNSNCHYQSLGIYQFSLL